MRRWWLLAVGAILVVITAIIHLNSTWIQDNQRATMPTNTLSLNIPAFADGDKIPPKYTCDAPPDGGQASPAIEISGVPEGTVSLALITDDPDIPDVFKQQRGISEFVHWVLFNIPAPPVGGDIRIAEGGSVGTAGANGAGANAYTGPCPPTQYEPREHRYLFKLYALDQTLPLSAGASAADVEKAMEGHVLAQAQYVGRYQRQ